MPAIRSKVEKLKQLDVDSINLCIRIDHIDMKHERVRFLEDTGLRTPEIGRLLTVRGKDSGILYRSLDQGESWCEFVSEKDIGIYAYRIFTTRDGFVLVRDEAGLLGVLDDHGQVVWTGHVGSFPWHGSEGIDQSMDGTVMFAEYWAGKEDEGPILAVWRARSPYTDWKPVFARVGGRFPCGEIRHFHVCRSDPNDEKRWWIASGDVDRQVGLWCSRDTGTSWRSIRPRWKQAPPELKGKPIPARRAFRLTSLTFKSDRMLWGTDDNLGVRRTAIVSLSTDKPEAGMEFHAWGTENLIRNIVSLGDDRGAITISEAKTDTSSAHVLLINEENVLDERWNLENHRDMPCFVTQSLGSRQFVDGCAFFPHFGNILIRKVGGFTRWKIE